MLSQPSERKVILISWEKPPFEAIQDEDGLYQVLVSENQAIAWLQQGHRGLIIILEDTK